MHILYNIFIPNAIKIQETHIHSVRYGSFRYHSSNLAGHAGVEKWRMWTMCQAATKRLIVVEADIFFF